MISFDQNQIKKLINQDESIFSILYTKTVDIIHRFLTAHYKLSSWEQEDIIANFYVKVREGLPKYNNTWSFEWYLWILLKNVLHDYFRKQRPVYFSELSKHQEDESITSREDSLMSDDSIIDSLEQQYDIDNIHKILQWLDIDTQQVIHMKYIEQLSTETIAQTIWLSNDLIRQKLSRGIKKIKQLLAEEYTS